MAPAGPRYSRNGPALASLIVAGALASACSGDSGRIAALHFTDVSAAAGVAYTAASYDGAFADLDRDGDLDLVISDHHRLRVLEGRGDGTFTDVTQRRGLGRMGDYHGFAIADVDGDRDLDLYATRGDRRGTTAERNELWLRDGERFHLAQPSPVQPARVQPAPGGRGRGAAFADLDGDGRLDCVISNFQSPPAVCLNDGIALRDRAAELGLGELGPAFCIAELDGDGRLDLVFCSVDRATVVLLRDSGVELRPLPASVGWLTVAAGDLDGDGHQDLIAARFRGPGDLAVQRGDELRARIYPDEHQAKELHVQLEQGTTAVDLTLEYRGWWWTPNGRGTRGRPPRDRRVELDALPPAPTAAPPEPVQVWRTGRNEIAISVLGRAEGVAAMLRVASGVRGWRSSGFEAGDPQMPLDVRRGVGDGTFTRWHPDGLDVPAWGAVPLVEDLDNDGNLDVLLITQGDGLFESRNLLFLSRGDGSFVECGMATGAAGPPAGVAFGGCLGDVDSDGDLDVLLIKGHGPTGWPGGPRVLLRNDLAPGRHWIDVLPKRADGQLAHGALVTVEAAGRTWTRRFGLGGHPHSRGARPCHFGLGAIEAVDAVTVELPGATPVRIEDPPIDDLLVTGG